LSLLLYIYYNADLLDIPKNQKLGLGFIDDITYSVEGSTDKGNIRKIRLILNKVKKWRVKHGVQFKPSKDVLVHFTRNHRQATEAVITINKVTIKPAKEAKYLGVICIINPIDNG